MSSDGSSKIAAGVAGVVLVLAGVLGLKGILQANGILALAVLAVGGFVAVALKDRWKRMRWGGGEIEMKGGSKPNWLRRLYDWTIHWATTPRRCRL